MPKWKENSSEVDFSPHSSFLLRDLVPPLRVAPMNHGFLSRVAAPVLSAVAVIVNALSLSAGNATNFYDHLQCSGDYQPGIGCLLQFGNL